MRDLQTENYNGKTEKYSFKRALMFTILISRYIPYGDLGITEKYFKLWHSVI